MLAALSVAASARQAQQPPTNPLATPPPTAAQDPQDPPRAQQPIRTGINFVRVDVIVTDWNMPEMSGIDFIRHVRATPATKHVPVLMVTTNAAKDDIVEALKVGVNSYVVKPFTPDTMKEKIEAVLAR